MDWDKLPGRKPPVCKLESSSESLRGMRVLITGAAGCIGSALAGAILLNRPQDLVLLDSSEQGVYETGRALLTQDNARFTSMVLGNVCDEELIDELLQRHKPQIIFHAAAFKHVPLLEGNPFAAVANNSLGTAMIVRSAIAHNCEQLILVSTDKAASPVSIMGASKRIAEMILLASGGLQIQMKAVRLGNVLNSPGSIVPLFTEQIACGESLTVTHPEVRRYFMTVEESVSALLEASSPLIGNGILVPRMGQPIRVVDLARYLYSDLKPGDGNEPEMIFTGLRPGDKLEEVLIAKDESWARDDVSEGDEKLLRRVTSPSIPTIGFGKTLDELRAAVRDRKLDEMLRIVTRLVPEYHPSSLVSSQEFLRATAAGASQ